MHAVDMPVVEIAAAWGEPFRSLTWSPITGGFSGDPVFNGSNQFVLKVWPASFSQSEIDDIHRSQIEASLACDVIPQIIEPTRLIGNRIWELQTWRPGEALNDAATKHDIVTACESIAQLHNVWQRHEKSSPTIPAITRRINRMHEYQRDMTAPSKYPPFQYWIPRALIALKNQQQSAMIQPWHGELHRQHILFNQDNVSGIIDFTALKFDHPAADVSRFLGEYPAFIDDGVAAYHAAGGSATVTPHLVRLLAVTGDLAAAGTWLRKLHRGQVSQSLKPAVRDRLKRSLTRLLDASANDFFDAASVN